MSSITPEAAQHYLAQWAIAAEHELCELRATSINIKFRQLAALMQSAHAFDNFAERHAEEELLRSRWQLIRRAYGV